MSTSNIGVILLAAGSSSRLGQSKQLLSIKGEPLLRRTTKTAMASGAGPVIVVLGSNFERHKEIIHDLPVLIYHNAGWEKGMGSSLKTGLKHLLHNNPETEAALFLVCDQPLLNEEHLGKMVAQYKSSKAAIIASAYNGTLGVPVLFNKLVFEDLLKLDDQHGAKKIIQNLKKLVRSVSFPEGSIEIDSRKDYDDFVRQYGT